VQQSICIAGGNDKSGERKDSGLKGTRRWKAQIGQGKVSLRKGSRWGENS
jgi:hypothetical protein